MFIGLQKQAEECRRLAMLLLLKELGFEDDA
jgi:hypothetical protein